MNRQFVIVRQSGRRTSFVCNAVLGMDTRRQRGTRGLKLAWATFDKELRYAARFDMDTVLPLCRHISKKYPGKFFATPLSEAKKDFARQAIG